ncbi:hypothetical protein HDV62DRAFT_309453 [Trichoderma sp. SZMC 28011]
MEKEKKKKIIRFADNSAPTWNLCLIQNPSSLLTFLLLLPFSPHHNSSSLQRLHLSDSPSILSRPLSSHLPGLLTVLPVAAHFFPPILFFSPRLHSYKAHKKISKVEQTRDPNLRLLCSSGQSPRLSVHQHSAHLAAHCRYIVVYVSARFRLRIQTFLHAAVISHTAET